MSAGDTVKGDNLGGGLPKSLLGKIVGATTGGGAKGTADERAALFLEIAREEHAALHPGSGAPGTLQATLIYVTIQSGAEELAAAMTPAAETQAIVKLVQAIKELGLLWQIGGVPDSFIGD